MARLGAVRNPLHQGWAASRLHAHFPCSDG